MPENNQMRPSSLCLAFLSLALGSPGRLSISLLPEAVIKVPPCCGLTSQTSKLSMQIRHTQGAFWYNTVSPRQLCSYFATFRLESLRLVITFHYPSAYRKKKNQRFIPSIPTARRTSE